MSYIRIRRRLNHQNAKFSFSNCKIFRFEIELETKFFEHMIIILKHFISIKKTFICIEFLANNEMKILRV